MVGHRRIASSRHAPRYSRDSRARLATCSSEARIASVRKALIASVSPSAKSQCGTWPTGAVPESEGAEPKRATRLPRSLRSTWTEIIASSSRTPSPLSPGIEFAADISSPRSSVRRSSSAAPSPRISRRAILWTRSVPGVPIDRAARHRDRPGHHPLELVAAGLLPSLQQLAAPGGALQHGLVEAAPAAPQRLAGDGQRVGLEGHHPVALRRRVGRERLRGRFEDALDVARVEQQHGLAGDDPDPDRAPAVALGHAAEQRHRLPVDAGAGGHRDGGAAAGEDPLRRVRHDHRGVEARVLDQARAGDAGRSLGGVVSRHRRRSRGRRRSRRRRAPVPARGGGGAGRPPWCCPRPS